MKITNTELKRIIKEELGLIKMREGLHHQERMFQAFRKYMGFLQFPSTGLDLGKTGRLQRRHVFNPKNIEKFETEYGHQEADLVRTYLRRAQSSGDMRHVPKK